MDCQPVISVITPAYNATHTLRACVESMRAQTYTKWEHIIVDDGSTDGTWDLLGVLSGEDSRLSIIRQANGGQGRARNVAVQAARGKYIALLDADDLCLPQRLELQVAFLNEHPDVDVLGGAIINVSENGEDLGISIPASSHEALVAGIYARCPFFASTVMARAAFFHSLGGFSEARSVQRVEDYDLWLRGHQCFRYHNLQTPILIYLRRSGSRFSDAVASARILWASAVREHRQVTHGWYAVRPLVAAVASRLQEMH